MFDGDDLRGFIDQATWLAVNDYEWELIRDRTGLSEDETQKMLSALIITRGAKGSEIHTAGKCIEIPSAKPSETADPTGCGDVWGATFLARLLRGNQLEQAMSRANRIAARNVGHRGAAGLHRHLRGHLSTQADT